MYGRLFSCRRAVASDASQMGWRSGALRALASGSRVRRSGISGRREQALDLSCCASADLAPVPQAATIAQVAAVCCGGLKREVLSALVGLPYTGYISAYAERPSMGYSTNRP